mmetsp:Transcript_35248/g.112386  ORF Transcript_35248/g.112386 Transcript_35248/m.112386 type:complete len:319 (-) Transcript_35248:575-1531(-)
MKAQELLNCPLLSMPCRPARQCGDLLPTCHAISICIHLLREGGRRFQRLRLLSGLHSPPRIECDHGFDQVAAHPYVQARFSRGVQRRVSMNNSPRRGPCAQPRWAKLQQRRRRRWDPARSRRKLASNPRNSPCHPRFPSTMSPTKILHLPLPEQSTRTQRSSRADGAHRRKGAARTPPFLLQRAAAAAVLPARAPGAAAGARRAETKAPPRQRPARSRNKQLRKCAPRPYVQRACRQVALVPSIRLPTSAASPAPASGLGAATGVCPGCSRHGGRRPAPTRGRFRAATRCSGGLGWWPTSSRTPLLVEKHCAGMSATD